jgi:hypothetical protein
MQTTEQPEHHCKPFHRRLIARAAVSNAIVVFYSTKLSKLTPLFPFRSLQYKTHRSSNSSNSTLLLYPQPPRPPSTPSYSRLERRLGSLCHRGLLSKRKSLLGKVDCQVVYSSLHSYSDWARSQLSFYSFFIELKVAVERYWNIASTQPY